MKMLELQQVGFTYPEENAPLRRLGDLNKIDLTMAMEAVRHLPAYRKMRQDLIRHII